jgi:hypothetical protein
MMKKKGIGNYVINVKFFVEHSKEKAEEYYNETFKQQEQ